MFSLDVITAQMVIMVTVTLHIVVVLVKSPACIKVYFSVFTGCDYCTDGDHGYGYFTYCCVMVLVKSPACIKVYFSVFT